MGKRRVVLYGGVIALILGWVASTKTHTIRAGTAARGRPESIASAPVGTVPALVKLYARAVPVRSVVARHHESNPVQAPYDQPARIITEARAAAESGSADAMAAMAFALHRCSKFAADTDEQIVDRAANQSIAMESTAEQLDVRMPQSAVALATYGAQEALQIRESCKDVSEEDMAHWREWMKKAASAGDPGARVQLALTLADAFPEESRLEDYDRYTTERGEAFDQLLDDFGGGDCGQSLLAGLKAASPDATTAYIFQSLLFTKVLDLVPGKDMDSEDYRKMRGAIEHYESDMQAGIPQDQLATAAGTIDYLHRTYCQ